MAIFALIRISGKIKVRENVEETMNRLKLRKKYTCVLVNDNPETMGMIKDVRDFIAYGKIEEKMLAELIKVRGRIIGDSKARVKDADKIAKEVLAGKKLEELKIKPFFGLHPARGGINTKLHYPRGVLGEHPDISKLMMKML